MSKRKSEILSIVGGSNPADKNVKAFLQVIRFAEGTSAEDGYNYHFSSSPKNTLRFYDMSDHPRRVITKGGYSSSAAGAYQILTKTWDTLIQPNMSLPDFTPQSQDAAGIFLLEHRGALDYVSAGNFDLAIQKANKEWASLPGSPYGQPTKSLAILQAYYQNQGGSYA